LDAIELDSFIAEVASDADQFPFCNRGAAAVARSGEDGVELVESEGFDWVFFVHDEGETIEEAELAVGTAADGDAGGVVPEGGGEGGYV
jgi:hypothetical protein